MRLPIFSLAEAALEPDYPDSVSALLIVGSLFSFLPILGMWMFPLGLIILSQDLPCLQRPLVRSFQWIEMTWERWRRWRTQC